MSTPQLTHVVTDKVRMSYVHVFAPYQKEGQSEAKYSMTVLLPKSDSATMSRITQALEAARQQGIQSCWNGLNVQAQPSIYDGDGLRPKDQTPFSPECKGHWVINCSSKRKPQVVDANGNFIIDESAVYSGCYGRVSLDFYPYSNTGGKGITIQLGNVQKLADGDMLGGGATAEQDFGATGNQLPGAPVAPGYGQAPIAPGYGQAPAMPGYTQAPTTPAPMTDAAGYQAPAAQAFTAPQNLDYMPAAALPPAYPNASGYAPAAAPVYPQTAINPITGLPM